MSKTEYTPGAMRAAERTWKYVVFPVYTSDDPHMRISSCCFTTRSQMIEATATYIDQETAAPELLETLKEIAKGEGPYSRDQLTFANNTISAMKELAQAAITLANEVQDVKN